MVQNLSRLDGWIKKSIFLPFSVRVFGLIFARNGKIGFGFLVGHPIRVNWSIAIFFSQLFGFKNHGFQLFFFSFKILFWRINQSQTKYGIDIYTKFFTINQYNLLDISWSSFSKLPIWFSLSFCEANTLYNFGNQELGFNRLQRLLCLSLTHTKHASAASRITAPAIKPQRIWVSTERDGADWCQQVKVFVLSTLTLEDFGSI